MILLPYENYNLYSPLPIEEVQKRLRENVQRNPDLTKPGPYRGYVRDNGKFYFSRMAKGYREPAPEIVGRCYDENGRTRIKVRIRWAGGGTFFWILVFGFAAFAIVKSIVLIISALYAGEKPGSNLFIWPIALGGPLTFYVIQILMFEMESKMATQFLTTLFEAQKTKP